MSTVLLKTYYVLSISCTMAATACMLICFTTRTWEIVLYDQTSIENAAYHNLFVNVTFHGTLGEANTYLTITTYSNASSMDDVSTPDTGGQILYKLHIPAKWTGGLWKSCDNIDGKCHVVEQKMFG